MSAAGLIGQVLIVVSEAVSQPVFRLASGLASLAAMARVRVKVLHSTVVGGRTVANRHR
jgi:hypothetical protein